MPHPARLTTLVVVAALAACRGTSEPATPSRPPTLGIAIGIGGTSYTGPNGLFTIAGISLPLWATVVDSTGVPVPSAPPVQLTSRAPTIIALDPAGTLTTVGAGQTYVVGTARIDGRTLTDSMAVSVICMGAGNPALQVAAIDSVTGQSVMAGATIHVWSPTFADSVVGFGFPQWPTAPERPDTYAVTVDHDGYLPWQRTGIVVGRKVCGVEMVNVIARLIPR